MTDSTSHSATPVSSPTPADPFCIMATAVTTKINYAHPDGPKENHPGTPQAYTTLRHVVPVTVNDARGHESDFSLDKQGFAFLSHETNVDLLKTDDRDQVKAIYYPEIAELLKAQ
jgi:hypothetical protein